MKAMKRLMAVLVMVLAASPALADDMACQSDADCPEGYGCMLMTCACACEDPEGECDCGCPEDQGFCEYLGDDGWDDPGFWGGECETAEDCPVGFICEEIQAPCAMPACPPCACAGCAPDDPECEPEPCECPECELPEDWECEPETYGVCTYDMVDCESDDDCGEGFECLEVEECWGGGSGCACPGCEACPEGEECEPCPPCDCDDGGAEYFEECEVVGSFCSPKEQPCEEDGDCLEGWECMLIASGGGSTSCACPDCACAPCEEGEECEPCDCPPCECEEEDPMPEELLEEGYCVPEGWGAIIQESGAADYGSYEEARDAMAGELYGSDGDGEGKALQVGAPEGDNGGGGGGGTGAAGSDPATGCATGQSAGAAPLVLLLAALAALALLPRRRTVTLR
ncbi:MAG: hypothetical protein FJ098_13280 [Deltaproteobacteria bacterium]|nr:hypothetical protein [Deltaproteobacteria bacterium]